MERTTFERYAAMLDEIDRLIHEDTTVCDVVRGSSAEPPYCEHQIKVRGVDAERVNWIRERLEHLRGDVAVVETAIALADSKTAEILTLHYREGLTWDQVALVVGGYKNGDGPRRLAERYIDGYW